MKRFSTHIKMIILFVGSNSVNPQFSWCSADADDWVEIDKAGNTVDVQEEAPLSLLPDHNQQQDAISSDVSASFIDDSNTDGDLSEPVYNMQPHLFEVISGSLPTSTPTTPTSTPTQEDIDTLIHQIKDFQIDETTRDLINSIMDEICEKATAPSAHQTSQIEIKPPLECDSGKNSLAEGDLEESGSAEGGLEEDGLLVTKLTKTDLTDLPLDKSNLLEVSEIPLSDDANSSLEVIHSTIHNQDDHSTTSPHSTTLSCEPASASPSSSVVTSRVSYAVPILAAGITLLYILTKKT